ncbi:T4 family baseplate hub assembly chaperone [Methylomonas sp. MgM2]
MLTASNLMAIWEQGMERSMFERANMLLQTSTGCTKDTFQTLTIGQRDSKLLDLREALFGRKVPCKITCPACNEWLELDLDIGDLRVSKDLDTVSDIHLLDSYEFTLEYRVPNIGDLAFASVLDATLAKNSLLERCVISAKKGNDPIAYRELPEETRSTLANALLEADPQSHLELDLTCPACEKNWASVFDITSFLWGEIHNWALRTLREVYLLASAFGWREVDILAMSPMRRQLYLEYIGV